jgi:hypothetical protein
MKILEIGSTALKGTTESTIFRKNETFRDRFYKSPFSPKRFGQISAQKTTDINGDKNIVF